MTYIQSILYLARAHIDKLITVAGAAITAVSIMLAIAQGDLYGGFWGVAVGTVITTIGTIMPGGDKK